MSIFRLIALLTARVLVPVLSPLDERANDEEPYGRCHCCGCKTLLFHVRRGRCARVLCSGCFADLRADGSLRARIVSARWDARCRASFWAMTLYGRFARRERRAWGCSAWTAPILPRSDDDCPF